jgi:exodeoxyribonuclease VII large subunit
LTIHYRSTTSTIIVFGNTYPVRERIKGLGGRFASAEKNWRIPYSDAALALVRELCEAAGGGVLGEGGAPSPIAPPKREAGDAGSASGFGLVALAEEGRASAAATPLAAPSGPPALTVRQLMDRAAGAIATAFAGPVWVVGEVQNLAKRSSGVFLELAEGRDEAHASATLTVRAVIWQETLATIARRHGAATLAGLLADGLKVRALCRVSFYRDRGQLSLAIEDLDPAYTKGALALAREELLRELRAKGLDAAQRRLPLPPFPFRVGLVSAAGSRAYGDFVDQLAATGFPGEVRFCAAAMQGDGVPREVVAAIRTLARHGVDLIVITRGGGSAADLRWFDAKEVAYAIAEAKVPIIAAIGHHEDVCVAEEVCHLRQKTPTAAADFVAGVFVRTRERIDAAAARLARGLEERSRAARTHLVAAAERLAATAAQGLARRDDALRARQTQLSFGATQRVTALVARMASRGADLRDCLKRALAQLERRMTDRREQLGRLAERGLFARREALAAREKTLAQADPSPWVRTGWTRVAGPRGPVRSGRTLAPGDVVTLRLIDARLTLRVEGVVAVAASARDEDVATPAPPAAPPLSPGAAAAPDLQETRT